jgi:hypothetical protein
MEGLGILEPLSAWRINRAVARGRSGRRRAKLIDRLTILDGLDNLHGDELCGFDGKRSAIAA